MRKFARGKPSLAKDLLDSMLGAKKEVVDSRCRSCSFYRMYRYCPFERTGFFEHAGEAWKRNCWKDR